MKSTIEIGLKRLALSVLPQPILYRLWNLRRRARPRTADSNALGNRVVPIQDGAYLEIYWTDAPLGSGPCVSMFVLREEVLRIDCLGGTAGHMHVNPIQQALLVGWNTTPRQFFPPSDRETQIERAVFELTANSVNAVQTNQLAPVRAFSFDQEKLTAAAEEARSLMSEMLASHEVSQAS